MRCRKQSQRGVTLLEMLVAVAILGVLIAAASGGISELMTRMKIEAAKSSLHMLAMRIRDDLGNADHLRTSADHDGGKTNPSLLSCVSPKVNCVATDPKNPVDFVLYRLQKAADGSAFPQKVVGKQSAPVHYDIRGEQCDKPGIDGCLFRTHAKFWATCPLDASKVPQNSCTPAEILNFTFVVEVIDNLPDYYAALKGARYPPNLVKSGVSYDLGFLVRSPSAPIIQKGKAEACGPGQIQDGIQKNGLPRCRCPGSAALVDPSTECENTCTNGQVLAGFDELGKVKCVNIDQCSQPVSSCAAFAKERPNCPCECINLAPAAMNKCSPGYWITGVETGDCKAKDTGKKGGNEPITCTGGFMICCRASFK
jgi:prepilin-type N-terminal cleavage/methylation domain-containing protein